MHLRTAFLVVLLSAAPAAECAPPGGCVPSAHSRPAVQAPPSAGPFGGQLQPASAQLDSAQRPPKPKPDRKKNNCTKSNSPKWKSFEPYRGDVKTNGKSGKHLRFYTWDHTHNEIEVWDPDGFHLGSMDPANGDIIKPAVPGRNIKKKIR